MQLLIVFLIFVIMSKNQIYVLRHLDGVKVGRTNDVKSRVKGHRTSNPWIEFIKSYEAPTWGEKHIHIKLKQVLKDGCTEWFNYYDGIYEDIDKWIEEIHQLEISRKKNHIIKTIKDSELKMFKLKDPHRPDYAFVIAKSLPRAYKILAYNSFIKVEFIEERELLGSNIKTFSLDEQIYQSSIRTRKEYEYCTTYNIDYNKVYGISKKRIVSFMCEDKYVIPERLWDGSYKKSIYSKTKTYKNTSTGRRKKKFNRNYA